MSLKLIADYISNGGKVLFAAGIPENNDTSYLYPIWGIIEKGSREETEQFHYLEGALPYPEVTVNYSGYNLSTHVDLNDQVSVLIEAEDGVPIVFSNEYQKGKTVLINGTLMDSKCSEGIFVSALGELMENLIYPIIGTQTVFLDEYPPLQYLDQDKSMEYYGMVAGSFLRSVLWPKLLQSASLYDLKYTAGIYGNSQKDNDTLLYNERLVKYLLKEVIRHSGEVTIMGDLSGSNRLNKDTLDNFCNGFYNIFPNYRIRGYDLLFGKANENDLRQISNTFEYLYTIRGIYDGDDTTQEVQDFEYKEGFVHFPVISSGFGTNQEGYDRFLSVLTLQGVVSHSFNIHSFFTTKEIILC
jgi:hypothetical protein